MGVAGCVYAKGISYNQSSSAVSSDVDESAALLFLPSPSPLRYQVDHHPDVTKFALENLDL